MKQVCDKPPFALRLVRWGAAWLMACWILFLAFIMQTDIDKQSVYLGAITFYGGVLYLNTLLAGVVGIAGWGRLAYLRHASLRRASLWLGGALGLMLTVHVLTQAIIIHALR